MPTKVVKGVMGIFSKIARSAVFTTLVIFLWSPLSVMALGSLSEGYKTNDATLKPAMAASLVTDEATPTVEAATLGNSDHFVGVVTTVDDNVVSLTSRTADVLVTKEGSVSAYVSNLNGDVKRGEILTLSPLKGVLVRVSDDTVNANPVGIALEDFPANAPSQTINKEDNSQQVVQIAKLQIEMDKNIAQKTTEGSRSFLRLTGETLTGKAVSQVQVIAALIVFLIVLILEGSIIYGAIHSSVVALGRNPLSKKAVFKQLLQVSWLALLVLVFGFGSIYLILWI